MVMDIKIAFGIGLIIVLVTLLGFSWLIEYLHSRGKLPKFFYD